MKMTQLTIPMTILLAPLFLAGCSSESKVDEGTQSEATAPAEDSHDHPHPDGAHDDHGAHGEGPHGGTLADWGGGAYHVEFTVDHDKQEAVVYVLGDDEKSPVPVSVTDGKLLLNVEEPAFQVELQADPQASDPEGTSSRFAGNHESLGKVQEFAGTISAEVDGTPYVGEFEEHAHEAH